VVCKIYILNKKINFQHSTTSKLLNQIQGNTINNCAFKVHNLCLLTYSMEQSPSLEANWFCS
jgi:hypothetical protein